MSLLKDRKGFIFSLDATLAILVVMIVMGGVALAAGPGLVYEQHGYLRLERYANDTLEVLQLTGTMDTIINYVKHGLKENAENLARDAIEKILPAEVQFRLVVGDNRLTIYPSDVAGWDDAFAEAEEIATVPRMSTWFTAGDNTTIALWHFEEGGGTIAYDETQNNNDGTLYGDVRWTAGKYGYALDFPGTADNYVSVPNSSSLAPAGGLPELSVEAWVSVASFTSGQRPIVAKRGSEWPPANGGWEMYVEPADNTSRFRIVVVIDTATNYVGRTINNAAPFGKWTHVAFTYNGSTGTAKVYVNGVDVSGNDTWKQNGSGNVVSASDNLFMGWRTARTDYFNGTIDEVRIENQALTTEEIVAHAASTPWEFEPVTLYVWRGAAVGG